MTYDLHIHSCLSPCADNDITPASIAGFAKLNGIDLIAVTDHNSALNLLAAKKACDAYGVLFVPGIEVNTAEEIHMLTYFKDVKSALEMGRILYEHLPGYPYDPELWGEQLVMNEDDYILETLDKLLSGATSLDIYQVKALCEGLGGIAVPAHADRDSFSILSVLGMVPEDLLFEAIEIQRPEHTLPGYLKRGRVPQGIEVLTSSDAHSLAGIPEYPRILGENSVMRRLLDI